MGSGDVPLGLVTEAAASVPVELLHDCFVAPSDFELPRLAMSVAFRAIGFVTLAAMHTWLVEAEVVGANRSEPKRSSSLTEYELN